MRPSSRAIATLLAVLVVYPIARFVGIEIREESHDAWLTWISYAVDGAGLLVPYLLHRQINRADNPFDAKDKAAVEAALAELGLDVQELQAAKAARKREFAAVPRNVSAAEDAARNDLFGDDP